MSTFTNITISGSVAVGKGTLKDNLKKALEPQGWKFFSGSELAHTFAPQFYDQAKTGTAHHHTAQDYDDATDRFIDAKITEILKNEQHHVVDAWLAGFNARELPHVLRVLLLCSQPSVIVDRIANRDHSTIEEAKQHIQEREKANFTKWRRLYGDYDFFDPSYYHLVIDTYTHGPTETTQKVLDMMTVS